MITYLLTFLIVVLLVSVVSVGIQVQKLKVTIDFLDNENRQLHETLKKEFVKKGYKKARIKPRAEPKLIDKL